MVRHTAEADDESTPTTFFEKVCDLSDGDRFELMGESLQVAHVRQSAAAKTVYAYGAHEDPGKVRHARYELVADARYDDVDVRSTPRTDTHEDA